MSQDLVKALGVTISSAEYIAASLRCGAQINTEYVSVPSLRAALEKLPVVEGRITFVGTPDNPQAYTKFEVIDKPHCTHSARLFAIEEIKKEPVKHEYECKVTNGQAPFLTYWNVPDNLKGKSVKVTVEEIVGE